MQRPYDRVMTWMTNIHDRSVQPWQRQCNRETIASLLEAGQCALEAGHAQLEAGHSALGPRT